MAPHTPEGRFRPRGAPRISQPRHPSSTLDGGVATTGYGRAAPRHEYHTLAVLTRAGIGTNDLDGNTRRYAEQGAIRIAWTRGAHTHASSDGLVAMPRKIALKMPNRTNPDCCSCVICAHCTCPRQRPVTQVLTSR